MADATMFGPEIITDILKNNKSLFITLGIILLIIILLKWFQSTSQRLKGI